jgi:hypothetical protein
MKHTKCECKEKYQMGVQYGRVWTEENPNHYDGVSEWECSMCGRRWGRWTGKELQEGEQEKRYGK